MDLFQSCFIVNSRKIEFMVYNLGSYGNINVLIAVFSADAKGKSD